MPICRRVSVVLFLILAAACGIGTPKVTTATFEPVYRAAKTLQSSIRSGVSLLKYRELLEALSTEISIAKDHELNPSDKKLLAFYQQAGEAYQFAKELWEQKIEVNSRSFSKLPPDVIGLLDDPRIERYKLTVVGTNSFTRPTDGRVITGKQINATDSMQQIWRQADAFLENATALYYGKAAPTR